MCSRSAWVVFAAIVVVSLARENAAQTISQSPAWSDDGGPRRAQLTTSRKGRIGLSGNATTVLQGFGEPMAQVRLQPATLFSATMPEGEPTCAFRRFMCKAELSTCPPPPNVDGQTCIKPVLFTGTEGSGTHFVAKYLSFITSHNLTVRHEDSSNVDILVSWAARCPRAIQMRPDIDLPAYGFDERRAVLSSWARRQVSNKCLYEKIIHIVRHPLKVVSSILAFSYCDSCWTVIEQYSVPQIAHLTAVALQEVKRIRDETGAKKAVRVFSKQVEEEFLRANMIYYVTWNRMIERVADRRYRLEDMDLNQICIELKLGTLKECSRKPKTIQHVSHGGDELQLTWESIWPIAPRVAHSLLQLAEHYGYPSNFTVPPWP